MTAGNGGSQSVNEGKHEKGTEEDDCRVQPHLIKVETNYGETREDGGYDTRVLEWRDQEPGPLVWRIVPQDTAAGIPRVLGETQQGKEEEGANENY